MIEVRITGETAEEVKTQVFGLANSWGGVQPIVLRPGEEILGTITPEEIVSVVKSSPPTPTIAPPTPINTEPKRGRGRPPGAPNKPKSSPPVETAPPPAPPASAPFGTPCCDVHAALLPAGFVQVKGQGCKACDDAIKAAAKPVAPSAPVSTPDPTVNLAALIKVKMREWILGKTVPPDALASWILGYGGTDLASIDPAKYPAMLADLDAKIGPKPVVKDPLE